MFLKVFWPLINIFIFPVMAQSGSQKASTFFLATEQSKLIMKLVCNREIRSEIVINFNLLGTLPFDFKFQILSVAPDVFASVTCLDCGLYSKDGAGREPIISKKLLKLIFYHQQFTLKFIRSSRTRLAKQLKRKLKNSTFVEFRQML